jgi:hypothetical protein
MHALLENAITYSYDDSKVVVSGTVQRVNPNLSHPSAQADELEVDLGTGEVFLGERKNAKDEAEGEGEGEPQAASAPADVAKDEGERRTEARAEGEVADEAVGKGKGKGKGRDKGRGKGDEAAAADVEESLPATPAESRPFDVEVGEGPVEPVFTPEILEGFTAPTETPAAAGTTVPPVASATGPVTPEGETVAVTETTSSIPNWRIEERDNVRISVQDHGVGIPARDLDRIFERFYRVDHGRSRDTGGTGLGLSIVRHVANNHQGWVDVESREGEGSTFTLVLPVQGQGERVV